MLNQIFATKVSMGQAWLKSGKRIPVTKLSCDGNRVVAEKKQEENEYHRFQIGFGKKKLKNMTKPLRTILEKSGFSMGVQQIQEVAVSGEGETSIKVGDTLKVEDIVKLGDIVDVQGVSKGRGFAGVMKRHGFKGGPRTHGQSDRERAPGSIGAGTDPGKVWKGKKMPGRFGNDTVTIKNLQIVYIDPKTQEVWVSGSIPGHMKSTVRITVQKTDQDFEGLMEDKKAEVGNKDVSDEETASDQKALSDNKKESQKETKKTDSKKEQKGEG